MSSTNAHPCAAAVELAGEPQLPPAKGATQATAGEGERHAARGGGMGCGGLWSGGAVATRGARPTLPRRYGERRINAKMRKAWDPESGEWRTRLYRDAAR